MVQLGTEKDAPVRVEFTVLPGTRTIDWNGTQVETRVAQFLGFREGRIVEAARDYFAQGADGSVWYFGEEVDNYEDGVIVDHEGTWLAGRDGPPGMIMPAQPAVGAVYRPENIPGVVLEEDTVKAVDQTVQGPRGPVLGAILVRELLMEGTTEEKAFAPGYGEFRASAEDEQITVAVAAPTDAASTPMPDQLTSLYAGAVLIFDSVPSGDWDRISTVLDSMTASWAALAATAPPPLLVAEMNRVLAGLVAAAPTRKAHAVSSAALDVALAALDLRDAVPADPRDRRRPPAAVGPARPGRRRRRRPGRGAQRRRHPGMGLGPGAADRRSRQGRRRRRPAHPAPRAGRQEGRRGHARHRPRRCWGRCSAEPAAAGWPGRAAAARRGRPPRSWPAGPALAYAQPLRVLRSLASPPASASRRSARGMSSSWCSSFIERGGVPPMP